MKALNRFLSIAVISSGLIAHSPAKADTAYHAVYNQSVLPSDPFSILDKHQNNALTPADYNDASSTIAFNTVDMDQNGFVTRSEYYSHYRPYVRTARNVSDLTLITPAAGGDDYYDDDVRHCRF
jgi:hypothetical protein